MLEEIIIRSAQQSDIDDLITVNISVWRSTYQGIFAEDVLNAMTPESLLDKWKGTLVKSSDRICYVAVSQYDVIGYVVCGKNRNENLTFDWELYAIYILETYQRKGIGKKLFLQAVNIMKERGARSFRLFVLKENIATRKFYEFFKPDFQMERSISLGGMNYAEIGYGWSDIFNIE
jgi:ribosomal protein S18 acetylase RimI-like enzyme